MSDPLKAEVIHAYTDGAGCRVMNVWLPSPRPDRLIGKGNSKKVKAVGPRKRRGRHGRVGRKLVPVSSDACRSFEELLTLIASTIAPDTPFTGDVYLAVVFVMKLPDDASAEERAEATRGQLMHSKRPDRGQLLKLLEDALERAGWVDDDAAFSSGPVNKVYGAPGERPGYRIVMRETRPRSAGSLALPEGDALRAANLRAAINNAATA